MAVKRQQLLHNLRSLERCNIPDTQYSLSYQLRRDNTYQQQYVSVCVCYNTTNCSL